MFADGARPAINTRRRLDAVDLDHVVNLYGRFGLDMDARMVLA